MSLSHIIGFLETTRLSLTIQETHWIIPTVQSVHILAIAVVMSSVLLVNLRLAGVVGRNDAVSAFTRRYLPAVWVALLILLATGVTLIVGEPKRELANPVFWTKMSLLITALSITLWIRRPMLTDEFYWESHPSRQRQVRVLAWIALGLWVGIIFCGRWIAYAAQP